MQNMEKEGEDRLQEILNYSTPLLVAAQYAINLVNNVWKGLGPANAAERGKLIYTSFPCPSQNERPIQSPNNKMRSLVLQWMLLRTKGNPFAHMAKVLTEVYTLPDKREKRLRQVLTQIMEYGGESDISEEFRWNVLRNAILEIKSDAKMMRHQLADVLLTIKPNHASFPFIFRLIENISERKLKITKPIDTLSATHDQTITSDFILDSLRTHIQNFKSGVNFIECILFPDEELLWNKIVAMSNLETCLSKLRKAICDLPQEAWYNWLER